MVDVWALFLMLLKLLSYSAVVSGIGAVLLFTLLPLRSTFDQYGSNRFQFWLNRWLINWSAAGMILALLQLPLQAGAMAESGPAAMMDTIMLNIVWQSAIGSQTVIRFSGFAALLFAALLWSGWGKDTIVAWIVAWILAVSGIVSLAGSFILTGHTAPLAGWVQAILLLHVLAIAAWVGALWPLKKSCDLMAISSLLTLMERFGRVAVVIVIVLLSCGLLLLLQLIGSLNALFTTDYGRFMLFKLMLVSCMLLLAAWHKFKLVKDLARHHNSDTLRRSIMVETLLAVLVLTTTTVFTTVVGPTG
ncbi:CopD family protein [Arsukibacterium sp.]|uniref:CopD family protein n=1 Tax=Arsukibacterium sp. TaxID=1977258 RepID=UPI00299DBB73|nr:CopD family protein [Arsukibacterium sp.]MDX1537251.1 CopD family protein [Arsukibacterium sp.]